MRSLQGTQRVTLHEGHGIMSPVRDIGNGEPEDGGSTLVQNAATMLPTVISQNTEGRIKPLQPSGHHTYHLLYHTKTMHSAHKVYFVCFSQ
jgi:hypothetical protein